MSSACGAGRLATKVSTETCKLSTNEWAELSIDRTLADEWRRTAGAECTESKFKLGSGLYSAPLILVLARSSLDDRLDFLELFFDDFFFSFFLDELFFVTSMEAPTSPCSLLLALEEMMLDEADPISELLLLKGVRFAVSVGAREIEKSR